MIEGPPKICLSCLQGLLRELARRHILNRAHEYRSTVDAFAETADCVQVLHDASGEHDSKNKVSILARDATLDHGVERLRIIGVDNVPKLPDGDF